MGQVGTKSALSQDEAQVLILCQEPSSIQELMQELGWKDRTKFRRKFIEPLFESIKIFDQFLSSWAV